MDGYLKKILETLEEKGEKELKRFSKRLQKNLVNEGEKLLSSNKPDEEDVPDVNQNKYCADGKEVAVKMEPDVNCSRDLAERLSTDAPPESADTAMQSKHLPAGATAGAAGDLRCPEVSEIFQSQPLMEGTKASLSCFIAGYFPQELNVTWLRKETGDGVARPIEVSVDYAVIPNETCAPDGESYQQMVTLLFTPSVERDQGAEFICQVGHVTLQSPIERRTRKLEVRGVAASDSRKSTPDPNEITSDSRKVTPDPVEVTPVSSEITPDSQEATSSSREDRGHAAGREEMHFVDRHREQLIQRVTLVEGVMDKLLGDVLDNEQYQTIKAERTNPMKMRKLYEFTLSWNKYCKDQLYEALKDKCKFLVKDLEEE